MEPGDRGDVAAPPGSARRRRNARLGGFRLCPDDARTEGGTALHVGLRSETPVSRVADALSRRDFIYLVLALSLFGKANWFLFLTAIGAPIFFIVLLALDRRHAERKPA
jgi:hypothetical protein